MSKFFVIINGETSPDSWSSWMWSDINSCAQIYLDNNIIKNKFLKNLKKIHFGNKLNKKFWLPFKGIWDKRYSVRIDQLDCNERNYIIFQSGVKFSPRYIRKLKTQKNATIILYLPDTIKNLGIADHRKDFEKYRRYYEIDQVYSFDKEDCKKYNLRFFDLYSSNVDYINRSTDKMCNVFYVGNCRSNRRFNTLLQVYEKLQKENKCEFHIVGVDEREQVFPEQIVYNRPLKYGEVVKKILGCDCILEVINEGQDGNTLRFKEAICYNRRLLTNNQSVYESEYYNPDWIQVFDSPDQIDVEWIKKAIDVKYDYDGRYSPVKFLEEIVGSDGGH